MAGNTVHVVRFENLHLIIIHLMIYYTSEKTHNYYFLSLVPQAPDVINFLIIKTNKEHVRNYHLIKSFLRHYEFKRFMFSPI